MKKLPFRSLNRSLIIPAIITIIPLALLACGSGSSGPSTSSVAPAPSEPVSQPAAAAEEPVTGSMTETAKDEPGHDEADGTAKEGHGQDEAVETAKTGSEMTKESESGGDTAMVMEADPATTAETEAPAAALLTAYNDFGFSLKLDRGASVESYGWTEAEPSLNQGLIAFAYGGVNTNMVWSPPEDRDPLILLADTYNLLRASQPETEFDSISDGEVTVNGQTGVYGGFKASGVNGESLGGGLIGAWLCPGNEMAYRLTLTGDDATLVQLRFDRLLENFSCGSSS